MGTLFWTLFGLASTKSRFGNASIIKRLAAIEFKLPAPNKYLAMSYLQEESQFGHIRIMSYLGFKLLLRPLLEPPPALDDGIQEDS